MERTQPLPRRARLLERHDLADDRDDVGLGLQVVEEGLGKSAIVSPSAPRSSRRCPPSFSGAGETPSDQRMLAEEASAARRAAGRCRGRGRRAAAARRPAAQSSRNFSARSSASSTVAPITTSSRSGGERVQVRPVDGVPASAFAVPALLTGAARSRLPGLPQVGQRARASACRGFRLRRACRRRRARCLRRRRSRRTRVWPTSGGSSSAPSPASPASPASVERVADRAERGARLARAGRRRRPSTAPARAERACSAWSASASACCFRLADDCGRLRRALRAASRSAGRRAAA